MFICVLCMTYTFVNICTSAGATCTHIFRLTSRELQTQLLHYFSKSDNKSNHHHQEASRVHVCVESCAHTTHFGVCALSHAQIHVHTLSPCHILSLRLSFCRQDLNPQPKCAPPTHTDFARCFSCLLPCVHACERKRVREREAKKESIIIIM